MNQPGGQPTVSALVVNYNDGELLLRCLQSLGEQDMSLEVLVADNGSKDGSFELARERFPDARFEALGRNIGFGSANNWLAGLTSSEFLLLINPDAWLAPHCLPRLQQALAADPSLGLVVPELSYPDGSPQFCWAPEMSVFGEAVQRLRNRFERHRWFHQPVRHLLMPLLGPGWHTAACVLVRRSAFDAVGGFDECYFLHFEDVDLCRRLRAEGWKTAIVRDARAIHHKGGSGEENRLHAYRAGQIHYYRRYRPEWEQQFLRWWLSRRFRAIDNEALRARLLTLLQSDADPGALPARARGVPAKSRS